MKIISSNENETVQIAQDLAQKIKQNDIILLHGNLGMGKSVFARAIIKKLTNNADLEVPSPTFTLLQTYEISCGQIYHFDLYRLKCPDEIYELGWEEALNNSIVIIEWPERLGTLKPKSYINVSLKSVKNKPLAREICIDRIE
ncbi:MAG: tRNA (adenosine(37)-N6)-threonylcarbamoyltransferase complex ATPase subunit type 1 TsaE [Alphaproteobacteria bacterium]|nr:tRNA (adenosine(37)-N6)-threonylcarbamoyltransferase complex ATPase subunit type 1 TsaE [Alphaproteobacteria bacterium]